MKSIEIYGFVGWISSYLILIVYLFWAFLPEKLLIYFPSKYWAMAVPSLIVTAVIVCMMSYMCINMIHVKDCSHLNSLEDEYTRFLNLKKTELHEGLPEVYDLPAPVSNNALYYQQGVLSKYRKVPNS